MGFFDSLLGKTDSSSASNAGMSWISLNTMLQLDDLVRKSMDRTQIIFKHSTTCGISGMVFRMFSSAYKDESHADFYLLDLHAHRELSNAVASRFGVIHQSPQLLVINMGKVVFDASHGAIADMDVRKHLKK